MINIDIKESKKICEDYSMFITFEYNNDIVAVIKRFDERVYNPDKREWEVGYSKLSALIEQLPYEEFNISYDFPEPKEIVVDLPEFDFKTKPYQHQIESFDYGLEHDKWFLGDEMGCISGNCKVWIKERNKKATRQIKLKNLYKQFHSDNTIQVKSLVNGRFAYMPVKAVLDKGIKDVVKITFEDNTELVCTPDHLIYADNGWVEAGMLKISDNVFSNGQIVCKECGTPENLITYKYSKFYGYCKQCMYKKRRGRLSQDDNTIIEKLDKFGYVRLFGMPTRTMPNYERLVSQGGIYKHHQVWYEHTGHIVDTSVEVIHHKNGIKTDNRFENLELLPISEHCKRHADTKTSHLYQFNSNLEYVVRKGTKIELVPKLKKIINIVPYGTDNVYDIVIDDEYIHNFICNGIVVHNCGKTKEVIDIAVAKKQMYNYRHCLIICGVNGLKWNWLNEVKVHSYESAVILGNRGKASIGNADKIADLQNIDKIDAYFIITNVESLRNDEIVNLLADLCKKEIIGMIAFDEAHTCKNPQTAQGKGLLKLKTETMIAMTGTPVMNNPLDLFIILRWLGYEKHSMYAFKNHYCIMGGYGGYEITGYKNMPELQERLNKIMLRRKKEEVLDLPEKVYIDEYVEMGAKQAQIYRETTAVVKENIDKIKSAVNPLSELIRMRQATGYTGILSSTVKESAKLDRMEELVEEAVANGTKVVIFSNWTQMTTAITDRLKKYNPLLITGDTKDTDRQYIVDLFQNDPNRKVIVGSMGAMGTGITLTAGTVEIFVDEPWNMALKEQCVDRCHRIGQKNNLTIYTLLSKNTIDEKIHELVLNKGAISDIIVDGQTTNVKTELIDYLIN